MINGNASNDFEFDTLTNPRLLRGKKEQLETPPSDLEVKIEEGREFFHQKHTYKFKEQILYNTLSSKYFKDSNFDLANLAYYQNYFRPTEDFVSRNRNLIQNLRTEYINGGYLKKEKENEEEDANKKGKLEKLNKRKKAKSENKTDQEMKMSVGNLSMVLKDKSDDINREMKLIIILRFLENIFLQFEYKTESLNQNNSEIEKDLCDCLQFFENEFVNVELNEKVIEILEKFEIIAMIFPSSALLIKILLILKNHNISLNNFSSLYTKFFKNSLKANSLFSFRLISKNEKSPSLLSFNYDIDNYSFIADDQYIYLFICTKSIWHALKLTLHKDKITIIKESVISLNELIHINIIDNNNELYLYTTASDNTVNVYVVDKDTMSLISTHKITNSLFDSKNIITTFTSKSFFYILYKNSIVKIDFAFNVTAENFKIKSDDFGDFTVDDFTVNDLKGKKDFFFLNDEYICFPLHLNLAIFKLEKKILRMYLNCNIHLNEKSNDPIFYNANTNICYCTKVSKKIISIQELANKKMNSVYYSQINKINKKIFLSKKILYQKFNNKEDKDKKLAQFDVEDYLINSEYDKKYVKQSTALKFIIDKEAAEAYFNLFYNALVKEFAYYSNVANEVNKSEMNHFIKMKSFIANYENDLFINELIKIVLNKESEIKDSAMFILKNLISIYLTVEDKFVKLEKIDKLSSKLSELYKLCINEISNDTALEIVMLLTKASDVYDSLIQNKKIENLNERLSFIMIKINSKKEIDSDIVKEYCEIENEILYNNSKKEILNYKKMNYMHDIIMKYTIPLLLEWNCDITSKNSYINQLYHITLHSISSIFSFLKNDISNANNVKNSISFKLFFLYINVIIAKSKKTKFDINYYISSLLNIIISFDEIASQLNTSTHNLIDEESIILSSNHPCECDKKKVYNFDISTTQEKSINILFDSFSYIEQPGSISVNTLGPYNTNIPTEVLTFNLSEKKVSVNYLPQSFDIASLNKDTQKMSYGFTMKISNYKESEANLIFNEIYQTLIYSIGKILYEDVKEMSNLKEKDSAILKSLFTSKLFENLSIDNSNQMSSDIYTSMLSSIENKEKKENLLNIVDKLSVLKLSPMKEDDRIDLILKNIKNYDTNEKYKKTIEEIHKMFIGKNIWGNILDAKMRKLIMILFSIVLKSEKLLYTFDEFVTNYTNNNKQITEISNYKLFYMIYTEISKIKIWFNQKQKDIAEDMLHKDHKNEIFVEDNVDKVTENYLQSLILKANYLLSSIRTNVVSSLTQKNKKNALLEFNQNYQDIIDNLLQYIETDEIDIQNLNHKILSQNKYAIQKIKSISILNIILSIVSSSQCVKDILFFMTKIIKGDTCDSNSSLIYFNHDIYGADMLYVHRNKIEIYTFIMLLLDKLQKEKNSKIDCNKFDIDYYIAVMQCLIWPLKKRDYPFIEISKFFDVFSKNSTIASLLVYNDINNLKHNLSFLYEVDRVNISSLYQLVFDVFAMYAFIVFDKYNEVSIDEGKKKNLGFKRRISEFDENESNRIIKQISDIIIKLFIDYIVKMRIYKNESENIELINEEKLNSFLILFYRLISFNAKLINFFLNSYSDVISILMEILLYSSEKNKYIVIKLIEIFLLSTDKTNYVDTFKSNIEQYNNSLYKYLSNNEKENNFIVHFLFNYAMLLQQSEQHSFFFKTQCDFSLSIDIIKLIQNLLLSNATIVTDISLYISKIVNSINSSKVAVIALMVLGFAIDAVRIGAEVLIDIGRGEKTEQDSFNKEEVDDQHQMKKGIVIGFSDVQKGIFNLGQGSNSEFNLDSVISYNNFYFSEKKFAYVVLEENLTKNNFSTLSFDVMTIDVNEIKLHKTNVSSNKIFYEKVKKMKIFDVLIENFEKMSTKLKFITLSIIKDILSSNSLDNIDKIFKIVLENSLTSLDIKQSLLPIEFLKQNLIEDICAVKFDHSSEDKSTTSNAITSTSIDEQSEDISMFLIEETSLYAKFNGNLIKELSYNKIINASLFTTCKNFLPIYNYQCEDNFFIEKDKTNKPYIACIDFSLFDANLVTKISNAICVKYIITNNDIDPSLTKDINMSIIVLDMEEYNKCIGFLFDKIPSEDYEIFYMESIQKDFTMLIEIPIEMINETAHLSQRDLILNVIGAIDDKENTLEIASDTKGMNILSEKEKSFSYSKMLSMISRRLLLMILSEEKEKRSFVDISTVKTILKLMLFEVNRYAIEANIAYNSIKEKNINKNDIIIIVKNFLRRICANIGNKLENDIISSLLDLAFLRSVNYIDFSLIEKIESERELIKFENIENSLKIIFFLLPIVLKSTSKETVLSFDLKEYEIKLFISLVMKINDFNKSSSKTYSFMLDILLSLLKGINDKVIDKDTNAKPSEEEIKICKKCIESLDTFQSVFSSKEFLSIIEKANNSLSETKAVLTEQDAKIINFVFLFIDLSLKLIAQYDINVNFNAMFNMKIMHIYFTYSLLNKQYNSKTLFLLFCQKRGIVSQYEDTSIKKEFSFYYYDKEFSLPHLMHFSSGKNEKFENLSIKVKSIDPELIQCNNCIFVYKDQQCKLLQDYIRSDQIDKEIYIQNDNENEFYISFPYTKFTNNLYGCGSNEKQSLGCGGDSHLKYLLPRKCLGLDTAKNILDFKFGYFHTFVQTADGNLFTCGNDSGSSFKVRGEYSSFNLDTHFQDLSQKEGIVGVWVNNYNASILLTKQNNLYGCGNNNEFCLTNQLGKNATATTPFLMTPIKQKVKEIACGFKSSFFILEDGSAMTVGSNQYHQCGSMGGETNGEYFHLLPPSGGRFRHVVAGEEYFILLVDEQNLKGRLYSMGCNEYGRAGVGRDTSNRLQKCKGVECYEFTVISSRNDATAAITSTGELYTFGYNGEGALGICSTSDALKPTLVESLSDYICEDVGISHHHMLIIARNKHTGEKCAFSCGTSEYSSLGCERNQLKVLVPTLIPFFKQDAPTQQPIRVSVSRFQSYFLTMESQMQWDLIQYQNSTCHICSKDIQSVMYFSLGKDGKIVFTCDNCAMKSEDKEKKAMYAITTPKEKIINDIAKCDFDAIDILSIDSKYKKEYTCISCGITLDTSLYISSDNENIFLCHYCFSSKCSSIEYPQVFYYLHNISPNLQYIVSRKSKNFSSKLYPSINRSDKPFLTLEMRIHLTKVDEFKSLLANKKMDQMFYSFWKSMSNVMLTELNKLKDQLEQEQLDKEDNSNILITNDAYRVYSSLQKIIKEGSEATANETQISFVNKYKHISKLSKENFILLFELSNTINNSIFDLLSISNCYKEVVFFHKTISENLEIINSKDRLNIFNDKLDKLKVSVNPGDKVVEISRIKAVKFYESNQVDTAGDKTVFGQLFQKMKKYPLKNYCSQADNRLYIVTLLGEGSTDYGGPYRDVLTTICDELQSNYLELFIKSPNHKNEIGLLRDKWVPNPSAKSAVNLDMYFFLGCMLGHAISSGHLLSLNLHPIVWNKILNIENGTFSDIESVDKLFYKYITEIEKTEIKTEEEFTAKYPELSFTILLSDESEFELVKGGKGKKVTLANKNEYVSLAKKYRINEFNIQIESIRSGLINVIPENVLSLLMGKELEELACGKPILNLTILKQFTEYQGYSADDPVIINFWKALEEFSNEDRVAYLKYVWGRTRLPDPNVYKFTHTITKMGSSIPDKRLPTATTCYFTLKLPKYSTYEILKEKLKYVIANCSEIDTDFTVSSNEFD